MTTQRELVASAPSTSSWRFGHLNCGGVANPTTLQDTLPETNWPFAPAKWWLENKLPFLGWPIFRDYLSFREGNILFIWLIKRCWNYFAKKYWHKLRCVNLGQICHISLWHINKTSMYEIWYVVFLAQVSIRSSSTRFWSIKSIQNLNHPLCVIIWKNSVKMGIFPW